MPERRAFKPSIFKRILAWGILLFFGGCTLALFGYTATHFGAVYKDGLGAVLGIGGFCLALALMGVILLRTRIVLDGETIEIIRPPSPRSRASANSPSSSTACRSSPIASMGKG
jgi:hypothetical protein